MVSICDFFESQTAPFAGSRSVLVSPVELNVLDRVPKSQFVNTGASSNISVHFDNGQSVNKFLRICQMRIY